MDWIGPAPEWMPWLGPWLELNPLNAEPDGPPTDGPPLTASKADWYEEAGANDGMDCGKNGALESGPKEEGELIDEPKEPLNGEWEPLDGDGCGCEAPERAPNGSDGEMENVEPPKLNDGTDWLGKRPCEPAC